MIKRLFKIKSSSSSSAGRQFITSLSLLPFCRVDSRLILYLEEWFLLATLLFHKIIRESGRLLNRNLIQSPWILLASIALNGLAALSPHTTCTSGDLAGQVVVAVVSQWCLLHAICGNIIFGGTFSSPRVSLQWIRFIWPMFTWGWTWHVVVVFFFTIWKRGKKSCVWTAAGSGRRNRRRRKEHGIKTITYYCRNIIETHILPRSGEPKNTRNTLQFSTQIQWSNMEEPAAAVSCGAE